MADESSASPAPNLSYLLAFEQLSRLLALGDSHRGYRGRLNPYSARNMRLSLSESLRSPAVDIAPATIPACIPSRLNTPERSSLAPGYPRVGFIVTNLSRPAERVVAFYNQRGKAEQYIKEGKHAIKWTRLSCGKFRNNAVRLQLHVLAYNLANFMRTLALPKEIEHWSLTTLREKLIKIGAKVVRHGCYVTFQLAEVAVPRKLFQKILSLIYDLRRRPVPA